MRRLPRHPSYRRPCRNLKRAACCSTLVSPLDIIANNPIDQKAVPTTSKLVTLSSLPLKGIENNFAIDPFLCSGETLHHRRRERWRSPAAGSGSEARADAGGSQVQ